jgi:hypothetical protein
MNKYQVPYLPTNNHVHHLTGIFRTNCARRHLVFAIFFFVHVTGNGQHTSRHANQPTPSVDGQTQVSTVRVSARVRLHYTPKTSTVLLVPLAINYFSPFAFLCPWIIFNSAFTYLILHRCRTATDVRTAAVYSTLELHNRFAKSPYL